MATERRRIYNGPSKLDLMLALFDPKGRKVEFAVAGPKCSPDIQYLGTTIWCVRRISGEDGEFWGIEGLAVKTGVSYQCGFKAHYRTDRRTGWFECGDDKI